MLDDVPVADRPRPAAPSAPSAPSARPVRVTLVQDGELATAGFRVLLSPFRDVAVVDLTGTVPVAEVDLVLIDPAGLSPTAGGRLVADLARHHGARVAVFTWCRHDLVDLSRFDHLGAWAVIAKESSAEDLHTAVLASASGLTPGSTGAPHRRSGAG